MFHPNWFDRRRGLFRAGAIFEMNAAAGKAHDDRVGRLEVALYNLVNRDFIIRVNRFTFDETRIQSFREAANNDRGTVLGKSLERELSRVPMRIDLFYVIAFQPCCSAQSLTPQRISERDLVVVGLVLPWWRLRRLRRLRPS